MATLTDEEMQRAIARRPQWQADADVAACNKCTTAFSLFNRRHHCRYCGKIFCDKCTSKRAPIKRFGYIDPQRLCESCFTVVQVSTSTNVRIGDADDQFISMYPKEVYSKVEGASLNNSSASLTASASAGGGGGAGPSSR